MLKNSTYRRVAITSLFLLVSLILYNYPEYEVVMLEEQKNGYNEIYLGDKNNYVSLVKSSCISEHKDVLSIYSSLVSEECIPEGFKSYIPESTRIIDYSINDHLLKVNFSKEFLNVKEDDERKLIEMLVYSFTMIDEVKDIMIFVDGKLLDKLPNSLERVPVILDRSYGINKIIDITSFKEIENINVYYLNKDTEYYYVPVTYVVNSNDDVVNMVIKKLKSNSLGSSLLTHLTNDVEVVDYDVEEEKLSILFNKELNKILFDGELNEEVKYALVNSFADTLGVKYVDILVSP